MIGPVGSSPAQGCVLAPARSVDPSLLSLELFCGQSVSALWTWPTLREHLSGALSPASPCLPNSYAQIPIPASPSPSLVTAYAYEQIQYGTDTYRSGIPLDSLPDSCPPEAWMISLALTAHYYLAAATVEALRCCSSKKDLSSAWMTPADPLILLSCSMWQLPAASCSFEPWKVVVVVGLCGAPLFSSEAQSAPVHKYVWLCAHTSAGSDALV